VASARQAGHDYLLYCLCIQANARADGLHLQVHMQRAGPGSLHGTAPVRPADGHLRVVRTIRFNTLEKDKNAGSDRFS